MAKEIKKKIQEQTQLKKDLEDVKSQHFASDLHKNEELDRQEKKIKEQDEEMT
eukprot:UN05457